LLVLLVSEIAATDLQTR